MSKRLCLEEVISDKGLVIGHDTGNSILLDRYAGWRPWWMWASPRSTTSSLVENKRHKINRQTTSHNQTLLRQQHHYHHHSRAGTKRGGFFSLALLCFCNADAVMPNMYQNKVVLKNRARHNFARPPAYQSEGAAWSYRSTWRVSTLSIQTQGTAVINSPPSSLLC